MISLNPILSATPGEPPTYSPHMAETFSWIPIENNCNRPLFAQANYITNLKDLTISLSASDINIGAVEIADGANPNLRATVVELGGEGNALKVVGPDLESTIDDITIGDKQGNFAAVDSSLSALNVKVTNPVQPLSALDANIRDRQGNFAIVDSSLSALNVKVTNPLTAKVEALSAFNVNIRDRQGNFARIDTLLSALNVRVANTVTAKVEALSAFNVNIRDRQGNFARVDSSLSALNVKVTNPIIANINAPAGVPITFADSPNIDAFGKLRVSMPYTLFDSKALHNKSSLFWSQVAAGSGTVEFTGEHDASVTLSVKSVVASTVMVISAADPVFIDLDTWVQPSLILITNPGNTVFTITSQTNATFSLALLSSVSNGTVTINLSGNAVLANEQPSPYISNGDYAIRQTSQRFNYQPGKSQLAIFTGVLSPTPNAIKRYGLFTSLTAAPFAPNLGLYFETQTDSLSSIAVVQNNGNNLVPSVSARREHWNIDKLDGKGPSGKFLQLSAANIFLFDFEWLGVGRVRFGTVIDGQVCYCHEINNAGNVQGAYLKSPNLPVRAEIRQIRSGPASMKMICSSVMSEGGSDFTGVTRSVDTGGSSTGIPVSTPAARRALIGVRLQPHKLDSVNEVLNASVIPLPHQSATMCPFRYEIISNPTLGGSAVTWNPVDSNSNFEYAVAPNNNVTVSGGTVIASGYSTLGQTIDLTGYRFEKFLRLGCAVNGVRDTLWLVITPLLNSTIDGFHGSLTFIESD